MTVPSSVAEVNSVWSLLKPKKRRRVRMWHQSGGLECHDPQATAISRQLDRTLVRFVTKGKFPDISAKPFCRA